MSRKFFRVIIPVLIVIEFFSVFLSIKSFVNRDLKEIKEEHAIDKENYGMYIQNDEGKYVEYTDSVFFPEGYDLNLEKSSCVDVKGNAINDILSINETSITMVSNKTAYCYLYFDVYVPIAGEWLLESQPANLNTELEGGLYRYQGTADAVNNNYICFGTADKNTCVSDTDKYMYRIIGINESMQLKLIKKEALNSMYYWHNSYIPNSPWPDSDLYKGLNGIAGGNYSNVFINNNNYSYMLKDSNWYNKIADISWKYGDTSTYNTTAINIYNIENGFTNTVVAKIGLWYMHDYYYGIAGGNNCSDYGSYSRCKSSWIHLSNNDPNAPVQNYETYEWTMTRRNLSQGMYTAWYPNSYGYVEYSIVSVTGPVRPVFYLNADITLSGSGTTDDPYIIN